MDKNARQFYVFTLLVGAYLLFVFLTHPDHALLAYYHLSVAQYRGIVATVIIPLVVIWYLAFYGFTKLQSYSQMIYKNKDGHYVRWLKEGVMILAFQLPLVALANAILKYAAVNDRHFDSGAVIISHYISLAFPLIAFICIGYGTRGLTEIVKARPSLRAIYIMAASFIVIGTAFTYFVFKGVPNTDLVTHPLNQAVYDLPNWALLITIVMPYVFMWFAGLLGAYELYLYGRKTPGIVYRRSWNLLALGCGWIILTSICTQYLTALAGHIDILKINALLIVIYSLLILLAGGYLLLALGAKKLQRIEEVFA